MISLVDTLCGRWILSVTGTGVLATVLWSIVLESDWGMKFVGFSKPNRSVNTI